MGLLCLPGWGAWRVPMSRAGDPLPMGVWSCPEGSGSTCGCNSRDSNARLVLDLILGFVDADTT